ncbi:hypothetical protein FYJ83_06770 [Tissierella sp. DSM 105185]|uniref:Uncharacterized protein n=2 Tax=Tissierella pigra TaxID=2607614 RepID=A0A6N7XGJ9_9FIRM|nr:hypothetical protein [Tissierella pigra]
MAELNRGIELMEYPFTPINMYDKIYSYGRAQETNPHPYAIALRDYLKEVNDKDDNNGYPPTAYLADINRDGIMEMLVNGTRLFYLQDGKLKTYDIEADFGDADYTMEFSQNNYLVAQPTVGDAEATTVLILKDGKIVKEPEFVGMYFLGYTSFMHGDKEISELEYEKLKEFYGVTEVYSNRKNQIDEILAMTNTIKAMTTSSKVKVNGILKEFESYNINGNNYFKLRDLAQVVNKTSKNFEVEWDGAKNAIRLISNKAYTPVGGELAKGDGKTKSAQVTTSAIYKDGKEISLTAYNIGGSNFFKLRDIAKAFDIGVTWDGPTNTVGIDTGKRYVAE